MNRFLILGILLVAAATSSAQQSIWRASPAFGSGLYDMECLDSNRVVVSIGDLERGLAIVLGTTDGGRSWDTLVSSSNLGLKRAFNELAYLDSTTVLALSSKESMLWKTTDRGKRWDSTVIGVTGWMASLSVRSDGYGAVIAYPNTVLTTSDAGRTWAPLPMGDSVRTGYQVTAVVCLDSMTFVCALDNGAKSLVLRTTDRGATWSAGFFPSTHPQIDVMKFTDPLHGWFAGRRAGSFTDVLVYRTTDGGLHWESAFEGSALIEFTDMAFRNEREGIIAGSDFFIRTTDGGRLWTRERVDQVVAQFTVRACAPENGPEVVFSGNGYRLRRDAVTGVQIDAITRYRVPLFIVLRSTGDHAVSGVRLGSNRGELYDDQGRQVGTCTSLNEGRETDEVRISIAAFGQYWLLESESAVPVARILVVP